MDTRSWSATSSRWSAATVGDGPFVLGGHSMGAHTAVAYALSHPERLAGLVVIGPVYAGEIPPERALEYWDGLADGARARAGSRASSPTSASTRRPTPSGARRSLRITRERMLLHRHPEALVDALREVSRSRPFDVARRARARWRSRRSSSPATTSPTPAIPRAVAEAYAEHLPQARLISEEEGESPLAWQGGKLSREIADFIA